MKRFLFGWMGAMFAAAAIFVAVSPVGAQTAPNGTTKVEWHVTPTVNVVLTPNYYTGYGAVPAEFGTQPTPTHGPGATAVGQGTVDFGTTLAGKTYLYKYAAQLTVTSNDSSGFLVYGEATAALVNSTDGTTYPVSQALFYLPSGATSDSNNGFSPALPFQTTTNSVSGGNNDVANEPPSISYSAYPNPIALSSTEDGDFYYDYEFKVPSTATNGNYYVWIVYTVVGQ
jgi:hypothetical protein